MGLFDIFKKREEKKSGEIKTLSIGEIGSWFEKEFSEKIAVAENKKMQMKKRVLESFPEIKKSIEALRDSKASEIKRLEGIINALKDSYVKRSLTLYSKFPSDYESNDFIQKTESVLKEMDNANPKEMYAVSSYFQEDSKPLIDSIKHVQSLISEYKNFIDSDGKIISQKQMLFSILEDYNNNMLLIKKIENETEREKVRIKEIEEKVSEFNKEIEKIKNSDKVEEKLRLENDLNSLENRLSSLDTSIRENLSPLKRPLKKFEHSTNLSKEEVLLVANFSKSPFKTFIESSESIGKLVKKIQESEIDLKDKDQEKLSSIDIDEVVKTKKEFLDIGREVNVIKSKIDLVDISKDIDPIKSKIGVLEKDIGVCKKDILSKQSSLENIVQLQKELKSKINDICLNFGVEIN